MGFRVEVLGFWGFGVLGFQVLGFVVLGFGFRILGFRVEDSGAKPLSCRERIVLCKMLLWPGGGWPSNMMGYIGVIHGLYWGYVGVSYTGVI